jgi:hypothetical protein
LGARQKQAGRQVYGPVGWAVEWFILWRKNGEGKTRGKKMVREKQEEKK